MVMNDATLFLNSGTLNKIVGEDGNDDAITVQKGGTLVLNNMNFNGNISGVEAPMPTFYREALKESKVIIENQNTLNGTYTGLNFNVGNDLSSGKTNTVEFNSKSVLNNNVFNIGLNGQMILDVNASGDTVLGNSEGNTLIGSSDEGVNNADLLLSVGTLAGDQFAVNLGNNNFEDVGVVTDSEIYNVDQILNVDGSVDKPVEVVLNYNTNLYKDNDILNNINAQAGSVSNYFSSDISTRKAQQDMLYANNIYSETVRAA